MASMQLRFSGAGAVVARFELATGYALRSVRTARIILAIHLNSRHNPVQPKGSTLENA